MTTKYIPGPWKATKYGYEKYSVNGENGVEICGCWHKANVRLIAAAPDMVEALQKLIQYAELVEVDITDQDTSWFYQLSSSIEKARQTLSKALGDDFKG